MRRVVVTGLGMVCPIGNDVKTSWENALAGKNGIGPITRFDASGMGCQIAGEVKDFNVEEYLPAKEARRYDRYVHYGVAAGTQAIRDAGLEHRLLYRLRYRRLGHDLRQLPRSS